MKAGYMKKDPGFSVTQNKGFHITLANGITVSVQFGQYNYCENYGLDTNTSHCANAELAAWDANGEWVTREYLKSKGEQESVDDVIGNQTPDEVVAFLTWAQSLTNN